MRRFFTDQMDREIALNYPPRRVISLVPSLTEYLLDLGVNVVGRTKFCVHPEDMVKSITVVGGTKKFRFESIDRLAPDLIIGNQEENYREGIEELWHKYPVWMSRIVSVEDAYEAMQAIGKLTGREEKAIRWIQRIKKKMEVLRNSRSGRALYLIWRDPWMAAGQETFIDSMLTHAGYENVLRKPRYAELTDDALRDLNPSVVLLSSEPYPFQEKHREEISLVLPQAEIRLVNGEEYSWYGSRIARI